MGGVSRALRRRASLLAIMLLVGALIAAPSAGAYTVATLAGFDSPKAVAISPDGATAYVANFGGTGPFSVGVVDIAGGTARATALAVGTGQPEDVAFAPDGGRAYVTAGSYVLVFDTATEAPVGSAILVPGGTPPNPMGIAITADGRRAYTANFGTGTIGVIDLVASQATQTSSFGAGGVADVAVAGSGTEVLATGRGNDTAWMVQTAGPTEGRLINTSAFPLSIPQEVVLSPDAARAYISNDGAIVVVDIAARAAIASWPVGLATAVGLALNPDGTRLYAALGSDNTIAVFDTATGQVVETINPGGSYVIGLAITPDGSRLVASNYLSNSVSIIQLTPLAPTGLSASASDTTATVSFTAAVANDTPITGYQYSLNGGAWQATTPASTASPLVVTSLTPGTAYAIRVRAVDARGPGVASATVAVTTQPPAATTPRGAGIGVRKPRPVTAKDGSVSLRTTVTTPGPGRIVQTATSPAGRAKAVTRCTARLTVKKAGEHVVSCRLNAKARAALRKGRLVLTVTTTFTATGATTGSSTTTRVVVPRRR
jgi:YVTN family beta-propeller protein